MSQNSIRESAMSFLNLVASGKIREAYSQHVGQDFMHHNPFIQGDRESLLLSMEEGAINNPNKKLEIKLTLADGNLVTTYSHVQQRPGDSGFAIIHIFRFENSRIVELWDIGQAVPEDSPNEYGMF